MFTGLIEEVGSIVGIESLARGSRLAIQGHHALEGLTEGSSIAVDGVCLTAYEITADRFHADVSPETIARTNLSYFQIGTPVNLERPLAAGRPIGGHFVQGHVDGIVRVQGTVQEGDFVRMTFSVPETLRPFLVSKGSVAVNGVSLTVASLGEQTFDVQLVPHTLERTNLTAANRAEAANLEVDILGKYVASLLGSWTSLRGAEASDRQELLGGDTLITLPGD